MSNLFWLRLTINSTDVDVQLHKGMSRAATDIIVGEALGRLLDVCYPERMEAVLEAARAGLAGDGGTIGQLEMDLGSVGK